MGKHRIIFYKTDFKKLKCNRRVSTLTPDQIFRKYSIRETDHDISLGYLYITKQEFDDQVDSGSKQFHHPNYEWLVGWFDWEYYEGVK